MNKRLKLLKKIIGDEAFSLLNKSIVKIPTSTVVDITEAHDALQIAPKTVMAFLLKELKPLKAKESKELDLPFSEEKSKMLINKLTNDVYSGHIVKDGKIAHEFSNVSIPQLSSHLLSFFELYDESLEDNEMQSNGEHKSKPEADNSSPNIEEKIKDLENKMDKILMMVAESKPQIVVNTAQPAPIRKNDSKLIYNKLKQKLQKNGLQPKMPSPPKPGIKVGGMNGITRGGIKGNKTQATDTTVKVRLNRPQKNIMNVSKSEISANCLDCGHSNAHCLCFRALSQPKIVKSENGIITLKFGKDWSTEALEAFYKTIKKRSK